MALRIGISSIHGLRSFKLNLKAKNMMFPFCDNLFTTDTFQMAAVHQSIFLSNITTSLSVDLKRP